MKSSEIRECFLAYFEKKDHLRLPSSSLIPANDPTLLFNNAGMSQFKSVFLGVEKPKGLRAVTAQKCVRAGGKHNDLDNVGFTARHHTFFEMLGNFSFGDYFKKEAIEMAWKFLIEELKLPEEKLYVTAFHDDDETQALWLKHINVPKDHFKTFGEKDNFWRMGDTGPCGPCSEIFYDLGPEMGIGPKDVLGGEGDRFVEIWNLVFMQFEEKKDGNKVPLNSPCVDTGMGLERISMVMQNTRSNYETDLFQPIINTASKLTNVKYNPKKPHHPHTSTLRVLADHARSVAFLIADGVIPSNEGRGYVLRRILRRAVRFNKKLEAKPIFLHLCLDVIKMMCEHYPELKERKDLIVDYVTQEEEKFLQTLENGERLLSDKVEQIKKQKIKKLPGDVAFKLYDTYGFPVDLTEVILKEEGLSLDHDSFNTSLEEAKKRSQSQSQSQFHSRSQSQSQSQFHSQGASLFNSKFNPSDSLKESITKLKPTRFLGYEEDSSEAQIIEIHTAKDGLVKNTDRASYIIFDQTPFYAEGGGQVGDRGTIVSNANATTNATTTTAANATTNANATATATTTTANANANSTTTTAANATTNATATATTTTANANANSTTTTAANANATANANANATEFEVTDVQKLDHLYLHVVNPKKGMLKVGDVCTLTVNSKERNSTKKNHSATHLLHSALIRHCGTQVQQSGSSVNSQRLRFDFSHKGPVSEKKLQIIEDEVNKEIQKGIKASTKMMSLKEAKESGAQALFGEKYDDKVRVLNLGEGYSIELCAGTHVSNTSDIGLFKIVSESSVGSGIRRIEAVTGEKAKSLVKEKASYFNQALKELGLSKTYSSDDFISYFKKLKNDVKKLKSFVKSGASFNDLDRDLSHDLARDLSHDLARDLSHDLARDLSHDLDRDLSHDLDRDLSHDLDHGLDHDLGKKLKLKLKNSFDQSNSSNDNSNDNSSGNSNGSGSDTDSSASSPEDDSNKDDSNKDESKKSDSRKDESNLKAKHYDEVLRALNLSKSSKSGDLTSPFKRLKSEVDGLLERLKDPSGSIDISDVKIEKIGEIQIGVLVSNSLDRSNLGEASDELKNKLGSKGLCVVVGAVSDKGAPIAISKTKDLDLHVGQILKIISSELGGKGGGRESFAQGNLNSSPSYEELSSCIRKQL